MEYCYILYFVNKVTEKIITVVAVYAEKEKAFSKCERLNHIHNDEFGYDNYEYKVCEKPFIYK